MSVITEEDLKEYERLINEGHSQRSACLVLGVARSTMQDYLKRIVDFNPEIFAVVFCKTKMDTQDVAEHLIKDGYNADSLHGDLSQQQRDKVMQRFRDRHMQLLIATDVAARGIDVDGVTHVINFELPDDMEVYTHRSGRTGRAGKTGVCLSICHSRETYKIRSLEKLIKDEGLINTLSENAYIWMLENLFYKNVSGKICSFINDTSLI